ncbi:MAG TPA: DUF6572 domain-containing protein [Devosiaceae bacterium]|jgi:hypothetical protein
MTIEQATTIDFASVDKGSGKMLLTISDHLPWTENEGVHLKLLQDKINSYLRFIESGELVEKIPEASGRAVIINVIAKFDLSNQAKIFYESARNAANHAGYELEFSLMRPN